MSDLQEIHTRLEKGFGAMGARVACHRESARTLGLQLRRNASSPPFRIDVASDQRGEYFDLAFRDSRVDLSVLHVWPGGRHLLLLTREPVEVQTRGVGAREKLETRRYLCGHDERHWFVAGVPSGSTVTEAMESLKPREVRDSQARRRVKARDRNRRKNRGFVRQGEWFFVPEESMDPPSWLVLYREPLQRGRSKPHIVDEVYRSGGELVYVSREFPAGLTEATYRAYVREHPWARGGAWQVLRRNPDVYARGRVRHPDHKTICLAGWHRVALSRETQTASVAFLD